MLRNESSLCYSLTSLRGRVGPRWLAATWVLAYAGCGWHPAAWDLPYATQWKPVTELGVANPMFVPVANRELIWGQVMDTVDRYFVIRREERVRNVAGELTPGWLETEPLIGSTILDLWRRDSTPGFERLHSTLQTIRRQAHVDMSPVQGGYMLQVIVSKELEDVDRPEHTTVGGATKRHDGALVRVKAPPVSQARHRGWIRLGRDVALEQRILWEIRDRLRDHGWPEEVIPAPGDGLFSKDQPLPERLPGAPPENVPAPQAAPPLQPLPLPQ